MAESKSGIHTSPKAEMGSVARSCAERRAATNSDNHVTSLL